MKSLLFPLLISLFFCSCSRKNGYTCEIYKKHNEFTSAKKLGIETLESHKYMSNLGPEPYAISNFNNRTTSSSILADSASCKKTKITNH